MEVLQSVQQAGVFDPVKSRSSFWGRNFLSAGITITIAGACWIGYHQWNRPSEGGWIWLILLVIAIVGLGLIAHNWHAHLEQNERRDPFAIQKVKWPVPLVIILAFIASWCLSQLFPGQIKLVLCWFASCFFMIAFGIYWKRGTFAEAFNNRVRDIEFYWLRSRHPCEHSPIALYLALAGFYFLINGPSPGNLSLSDTWEKLRSLEPTSVWLIILLVCSVVLAIFIGINVYRGIPRNEPDRSGDLAFRRRRAIANGLISLAGIGFAVFLALYTFWNRGGVAFGLLLTFWSAALLIFFYGDRVQCESSDQKLARFHEVILLIVVCLLFLVLWENATSKLWREGGWVDWYSKAVTVLIGLFIMAYFITYFERKSGGSGGSQNRSGLGTVVGFFVLGILILFSAWIGNFVSRGDSPLEWSIILAGMFLLCVMIAAFIKPEWLFRKFKISEGSPTFFTDLVLILFTALTVLLCFLFVWLVPSTSADSSLEPREASRSIYWHILIPMVLIGFVLPVFLGQLLARTMFGNRIDIERETWSGRVERVDLLRPTDSSEDKQLAILYPIFAVLQFPIRILLATSFGILVIGGGGGALLEVLVARMPGNWIAEFLRSITAEQMLWLGAILGFLIGVALFTLVYWFSVNRTIAGPS